MREPPQRRACAPEDGLEISAAVAAEAVDARAALALGPFVARLEAARPYGAASVSRPTIRAARSGTSTLGAGHGTVLIGAVDDLAMFALARIAAEWVVDARSVRPNLTIDVAGRGRG